MTLVLKVCQQFFHWDRYLIKRGLIPQERVALALETVWSAASKPPSIVRGAPETYGTEEAKKTGWAARDIGADMLTFVPGEPGKSEVWKIAEQLLGPDLIMPDPTLPARPTNSGGARACGRRTRGVYNTLPRNEPEDFFPGGAPGRPPPSSSPTLRQSFPMAAVSTCGPKATGCSGRLC